MTRMGAWDYLAFLVCLTISNAWAQQGVIIDSDAANAGKNLESHFKTYFCFD